MAGSTEKAAGAATIHPTLTRVGGKCFPNDDVAAAAYELSLLAGKCGKKSQVLPRNIYEKYEYFHARGVGKATGVAMITLICQMALMTVGS